MKILGCIDEFPAKKYVHMYVSMSGRRHRQLLVVGGGRSCSALLPCSYEPTVRSSQQEGIKPSALSSNRISLLVPLATQTILHAPYRYSPPDRLRIISQPFGAHDLASSPVATLRKAYLLDLPTPRTDVHSPLNTTHTIPALPTG
jgi:hypothetical protein